MMDYTLKIWAKINSYFLNYFVKYFDTATRKVTDTENWFLLIGRWCDKTYHMAYEHLELVCGRDVEEFRAEE